MFVTTSKFIAASLVFGALTFGATSAALAQSEAQTHMGHVTEAWGDTPDGMGFLPTAIAEAEFAVVHAGLAAQQLDNLGWMQTHANHVLQAVDASMVDSGPALGYGVLAASAGMAKHIIFAAGSDDASDNVKLHAEHVASTANNTMARVAEIIDLVARINAATTAAAAAPLVEDMLYHAIQLLEGRDANGDGVVGWEKDEGGLLVAAEHMGFMRAGENL